MLLLLALEALCWIPRVTLMADAASTAKGARRSPLGFVEAQGISSNLRSPSGPCIPSQHSEKARPCIPCILLVTVDRNRLRGDAEWETCAPATDGSWKQIVEPVMKTYTETTDGSTIEDKETAIVWCYEDADPDFGSCQANELHDHLESVLSNEPVSGYMGDHKIKEQCGELCHGIYACSHCN